MGGVTMLLEEILLANGLFVDKYGEYLRKLTAKPKKKVAIFTCMDTRLVEFLEPALGIKRGDAKVIKNAGNFIRHNCDDVIRSLAAAIFLLDVNEILVIGHLDCGMADVNSDKLKGKMLSYGIAEEEIDKADLSDWIGGFCDTEDNIAESVRKITSHPLIPQSIPVHGLLFCPDTGEIKVVVNGYTG